MVWLIFFYKQRKVNAFLVKNNKLVKKYAPLCFLSFLGLLNPIFYKNDSFMTNDNYKNTNFAPK